MQQFFSFFILTFIYISSRFGLFPADYQKLDDCSGSLWFYLRIVVTVVPAGRPTRPRTQHDCHHDTKVKSEAVAAVTGILMMGVKKPETF